MNKKTVERHAGIYYTIRERISLLIYPPNSVIGEAELAEEFNVSRTPIRSVLQQLQFEGLVDIRAGIGTVVTDIDIKTFKEIYDLRLYLTELTAEIVPLEVESKHTDAVESLLVKTKNLYDQHDRVEYARICNELHYVLMTLIGSEPLREICDKLYYHSSRVWFSMLPHLDWNQIVKDQEMETSEMLEVMNRNDIRGVVHVRRAYMHCVLTHISNSLKGDGGVSDDWDSNTF